MHRLRVELRKARSGSPIDPRLQRKPAAAEQRQGTADAALRERRKRFPVRELQARAFRRLSGPARRRASNPLPAAAPARSTRHRDRMVASSRPGDDVRTRKIVRGGGSSSDFSSALAAFAFMSSALSTMTTRRPCASALSARKFFSRRTSSTGMVCEKRLVFRIVRAPDDEQRRVRQRPNLPIRRRVRLDAQALARTDRAPRAAPEPIARTDRRVSPCRSPAGPEEATRDASAARERFGQRRLRPS